MFTELRNLKDSDQDLLVALAMAMIEADGKHTFEESQALQKAGTLIGAENFVIAAQRARERLTSRDAVLAAAAELQEPSLRQTFFDLLLDLARTDGLDVSEIELLQRLSTLWQLEWSGGR